MKNLFNNAISLFVIVIVLLIFGLWLLIHLVVIGLFLDIEFSVESKKINGIYD